MGYTTLVVYASVQMRYGTNAIFLRPFSECFTSIVVHYEKHAHAKCSDFKSCKNDIFRGKTRIHHQSFRAKNKKINAYMYPCKTHYYFIKVEYKGVKTHGRVIVMYIFKINDHLFYDPEGPEEASIVHGV